jgi:hypothetical protein
MNVGFSYPKRTYSPATNINASGHEPTFTGIAVEVILQIRYKGG